MNKLHDELVRVTQRAYPRVAGASYADRAVEVLAAYDPSPTPMQLYRLTAPLDAAGACYVGVVGLDLRRQRLADLARWADDGGAVP